MDFSERLQCVIDEQQISRYKVSKIAHISAATLANYTSGKTFPKPSMLARLSDTLGVSKQWLQYGEGEKYIVEEKSGIYRSEGFAPEAQQAVSNLANTINKLAESLQVKDQQISDLIEVIKKYQQ